MKTHRTLITCAAVFAVAVWGLAAPSSLAAQLEVSGQVDLLAKSDADERGLNRNFRGDSPYNAIRGRFFARHWVTDRIGVFTELLFDDVSGIRVQGAYLVVNSLADRDWLNLRAGLAPSLIGSFGLRSTYFSANPLLGVPLVWQHRTTLDGSGLADAEDLVRRRRDDSIALPMLYDACWALMWELLGEVRGVEYSLGVTPGAMSNPTAAPEEDGVQVQARVGIEPMLGLRIGVSGGFGPYIGGPNRDPLVQRETFPGGAEDYDQRLVGFDAAYVRGRLQLNSEGYVSSWEAPLIEDDPTAMAAYLEGAYDVRPRWQAAARVGAMTFSEIETDTEGRTAWDDDVLRFETALTYRMAREVHVRVGWQHTEFLTGPDDSEDLLAVQLRAVF